MSSDQIKRNMDRYGVSEHEAGIMLERGKVYGDPVENHQFIAMQITGLLSPWTHRIAANLPLPPHVIALVLCAVKMSRQRRVFLADNFDDMAVYQKFARAWQREWDENAKTGIEKPVTGGVFMSLDSPPTDYLECLYAAKNEIVKQILLAEAGEAEGT